MPTADRGPTGHRTLGSDGGEEYGDSKWYVAAAGYAVRDPATSNEREGGGGNGIRELPNTMSSSEGARGVIEKRI